MHGIEMQPTSGRRIIAPRSFSSCQNSNSKAVVLMAVLVICCCSLGISGCGGVVALGGSPTGSTKADAVTLVATPTAVDFGTVRVGNSANQKISIANNGSETVQISQLSLSNGAFKVDGEGQLPVSLATGSQLSFTVHFMPGDATDRSGQLSVLSSASTTPAVIVGLHGKGSVSTHTPEMSGLSCDDPNVSGSGSDSCTVTTNTAAEPGGMLVQLSSNIAAVKVPPSVMVQAGQTSANFTAAITPVNANQAGIVTATQGGIIKTFSLALTPPSNAAANPQLRELSCTTTSFTSSGRTACTVSVTAPSSRALSVALASSGSAVKVPASVSIPAKSTTASFNATVAAVSAAQTLTISATANESSKSVAIHLKASKSSAPSLSLSTSLLAFGDVPLGKVAVKSVTLTSTGTAPVTITSKSSTGSGFSMGGGERLPATLKQGQTMVFTIQFKPSSAGSSTGQLMFASNAGRLSVGLSGTGTDAKSAPTISAISCSATTITGSGADSCKVTLSGAAPAGGLIVALASSSTNLAVPGSVTVPATSTTANFVANASAVSSKQTAKLTGTTGSTSRSMSLQLNPASVQLSVDAKSISFGEVVLNHQTVQVVTLTSVGSSAVTVKSVSVQGAGFTLSSVSLPATLNPGQTLLLTLIFDPTKTGSATGQLKIASNSSTNSNVTLNLTGTATPHKVELNWNPPTTSVSQYKVYRATGGTGSFNNLGVTGQTTYSDTTVQSGQRYDYYVTSLGSAGGESKPSNTTTVSIP